MTDIRELLTLAARAMGRELKWRQECDDDKPVPYLDAQEWRPDLYPNDSHDMCAALGIDTEWGHPIRPPREIVSVSCVSGNHYAIERLKDHNNDRSAAWRMAALRVAAEIGKGMQG